MFNVSILFFCALFIFANAAYVYNLNKCGIKDKECLRKSYQTILHEVSENGIEDLGIPKGDPMQLHNITVPVAGMIDVTLVDGEGIGLKSCAVNSVETFVEKGLTTIEMQCDIKIQGKYRIQSNGGILKAILGENSIHGDGEGKVEMEKVNFNFDLKYDIEKRDNMNYFRLKPDDLTYTFDVLGKIHFDADNLYIGSVDIVKPAVAVMNENSNFIIKFIGKTFIDRAMVIVNNILLKFFTAVPADSIISDDLSGYIKS